MQKYYHGGDGGMEFRTYFVLLLYALSVQMYAYLVLVFKYGKRASEV